MFEKYLSKMKKNTWENMNNMKEILDDLCREGQKTLDIYFAEDISLGDENWFVDVMQDEINERCNMNWTWTVISRKEFEQENEENEEEIADWEIIVDKPFSDIVVKEAIENWLKERGHKFSVSLIPFEDAKGSGYIKNLRERLENKDDLVRLDEIELE